jgi:uncharacterized repeat protein (TIGR01451 family)
VAQTFTGFHTSLVGALPNLDINKASGTLTLAGTLRTGRNWTVTANAGLTVTGSTLVFTGSSGTTITGSHTLNNVEIRGGTITIAAGTTLTVAGTTELFSGTLNQAGATGTLAAQRDINAQVGFTGGGSATLLINGSVAQTFTGFHTSLVGALPNLDINKASGTLTLAGTLRTGRNWTHRAGAVNPGSSTVVFAGVLTIDAGAMDFADVVVNAGTATLAANLNVTGDLSVPAGTLATGSNIVFVGGDVTVDGGWTVTTGTLEMSGTAAQTLGGAAAIGLYNLTINNPAGVTQTTTVSVAGTLDLGGPLNFSGRILSIANAITGTLNDLAADATSTLIINGAGSGIVIPASLTDLLSLTITNPNGAALAGPLTVAGIFTLGGGNLDAGGSVLSIGPIGIVSRTSGHVVGSLQKWVATGSGVTLTYEIGDATTYAPLALTFGTVGVTGQMTASTTPGEHPSIGTSPIYAPLDVNRWWSLANAGVAFDTLNVVFTFVATDVDPGAQTSQFVVAKWDGAWTLPISGANTATTITAFAMTSLSEFAVGETAADLLVSKAGPASATAGDAPGFDYTLTVHNAGPSDNAGGFSVSDTLPTGLTFQALGSDSRCGAVGQTVTCTNLIGLADGADDAFVIHVTLDATVDGGTILANAATVTSTGTSDPDGTNDGSNPVSTTVVEDVQLSVAKAFASAAVVAGGASSTFTITVTNSGASDADNLDVTDLVDSRLTVDSIASGAFDCSASSGQSLDCSLAHLAAGDSQSFTVTYHVVAAVGPATVSNQADATSDEDAASGTDSVDVTTSADLADIKVDSPDPVVAGGTLTYTITVTNLGPSDALSVIVTDALAASLGSATYCVDTGSGCGPSSPWTGSANVGTIAAGASVTLIITATVDPGTAAGTIVANTASAGSTTPDPDGANNASSTTTLVVAAPTGTPTATPTPTGSLANTSASRLAEQPSVVMLLAAVAAWLLLLAGLGVGSARRRGTGRRP